MSLYLPPKTLNSPIHLNLGPQYDPLNKPNFRSCDYGDGKRVADYVHIKHGLTLVQAKSRVISTELLHDARVSHSINNRTYSQSIHKEEM